MKRTYRIPDMHCTNCAMRLESLEDKLEGIQAIRASYHRQILTVEFDETVLTEAALMAAIKKLDYTPLPLEKG